VQTFRYHEGTKKKAAFERFKKIFLFQMFIFTIAEPFVTNYLKSRSLIQKLIKKIQMESNTKVSMIIIF